MKFNPTYLLSVPTEAQYDKQIENMTQQLDLCRKSGFFRGFDERELFYEYFLTENSRGAVVVLHGLSEFTQKYHEFAYYLLDHGYDVFLFDQRSHGRSCRLTDRLDMIHVDKFEHYRDDLHRFVCDVVRPVTEDKPLYLYAHSMGGAVAALYLAEHADVFRKAVLSAPLIEPIIGNIPSGIARVGMSAYMPFANKKRKFWSSDEFDPNYKFEWSQDKSLARFQRNMQIRLGEPCYCTTPMTMGIAHQMIMLKPKLTRSRFLRRIKTPILMICASCDGVVSEPAQVEFAEKCGACQRVVLPDCTHSMLNGSVETITAHVQCVLDHFC